MAKKRANSEGSIYQRKDGRWVAQVDLGWIKGKRARKSYYGETRNEVHTLLVKAMAALQQGLPIVGERQTVADYLGWWVENVAKSTVRSSTWESYEELVRLHLAPAFKKIPLSKLTPQQIRSFMTERLASGLSTRRVQYIHAVLRAALNTAVKDQLLVRNPASIVKPPRVVEKEVRPLTQEQARSFLKSIQGDRLEALFTVAVSIGLRQGEALGLRWSDVDFEAGTLRVRYALQRVKEPRSPATASGEAPAKRKKAAFHLVEPKTKQSRRTVSMPKLTLSALAALKATQAEERLLAGSAWRVPVLICEGVPVPVDDLVFMTRFGNPFDAPTVTHRFQALLKRAGLDHHRFHDLRHTAATLLAVQGVHPRAIQAALGWENLSMLNRYAHFVEEQRVAVASAMDSVLTPVAVTVAVNERESKAN
jgi:integrase